MKKFDYKKETEIIKQWKLFDKPIVSVTIIAYNHGKFISESIESVLSQKTTYPYEIIIHDDASTDNTPNIILEYYSKYPNLIKPILQKENQWLGKAINATITNVWPIAKGKYIAWLEGDDYWSDNFKLQKQIDFLETNSNYVLTFHPVKILKIDGSIKSDNLTKVPDRYETQESLAKYGNYIHTVSVVFRNIIKEFPSVYSLTSMTDYFLYFLLTNHGKIKYLKDIDAVYREGVGIWSSKNIYDRNLNTAYTIALIISVMSKKTNIVKILLDRISNFIKEYEDVIEVADIKKLNSCEILETHILTTLIETIKEKKLEAINYYDSKFLLKELFTRLKYKLFKKFDIFK